MMQFLTKILSKDNTEKKDLLEKIHKLENVISDHESAILILSETLNNSAKINQQLCKELNLIGRWAASVSSYADEEKEELADTFGLDIDDDDEYLN